MVNRYSRCSRVLVPLAALLLGGCATDELSRPLGSSGFLGANLCPAPDGVKAVSVSAGSPAEKSRLRDGDVLIGYSGADLSAEASRKSLMQDLRAGAGRTFRVKVRRDGKSVELKLTPGKKDVYPRDELYAALADEMLSGRPVAVAVVVTQVDTAKPEFFANADALAAWKTGMQNTLKNNFETLLLNRQFSRCGNYGVVDRDKTDRVLKELNFQMTGAVSAETTKQVGRMTGASHLLFVDFTRFQQAGGGYEDDSSVRLVAVESGGVLASVRFRQRVNPR